MEPNKPKDMECPICEAYIPLEGDERPGDMILCSYCHISFKLLREKGRFILAEEFEE